MASTFLSTPSARRATSLPHSTGCGYTISIHALREEGDEDAHGNYMTEQISIHALREEGDRYHIAQAGTLHDFYPRPPRGGRRGQHSLGTLAGRFLSTPSARRATRYG